MKEIKGKERKELEMRYKETKSLGLTESQELRSFYKGDFTYERSNFIWDMMYFVDEKEEYFVLPLDERAKYAVKDVLMDTDFYLLLFDIYEDAPNEIIE